MTYSLAMADITLIDAEWAKLREAEHDFVCGTTMGVLVWPLGMMSLIKLAQHIGMPIRSAGKGLYVVLRFTPESYALWQLVRSEYENPEV